MPPTDLLQQLDAKLDDVLEKLGDVTVVQARQHVTLEEHMRRTAASEARLEKLEGELQPLKRAHFMWAGAGKVLATIGIIVALVEGALRIAEHFR